MNSLRRNLAIYVLAASFLFLGITNISKQNGASSNAAFEKRIAAVEEENATLSGSLSRLRACNLYVTGFTSGAFINGTATLRACF
jgi:hypothetical protein